MSRDYPVPFVALLVMHLRIYASHSVKDRRRVVRSLLDRIRRRWNVSAMDLGPDGRLSEVVLAVSAVANSVRMAEERLNAVFSFASSGEESGEFTIIRHCREVMTYDNIAYAKNQQTDTAGNFASFGTEGKE